MKKILYTALTVLMLSACSRSNEEKALSEIEDYIIENTTNYDTYKAGDITVDSIYAPMESPELYKLFDKYVLAANELRDHQDMITGMQTMMGKFTDMYSDSLIAKLNPIIKSLENYVSVMENMERMMNQQLKFVGYRAVHNYSTKENGRNAMHKDVFMFNNDLSEVLHQMRYDDYVFVSEILKKMKTNIHQQIEENRNTIDIARKLTE